MAIWISRYGGPEVLTMGDLPEPTPGPGEVLVRVRAAGINMMDIGTRRGRYEGSRTYQVSLPCTLGMEGAGDVVAAGEGVSGLAPGDRVAWCLSWGAYAEYVVVPSDKLVNLPEGIGYDQAAAALFQGATAHYLVHDSGRVSAGMTCLVHAGAGSIAQIMVQMMRAKGARVIATASTEAKREAVRSLGADLVLAYDGFADAVLAATDGVGVDVAFDAVGQDTLRDTFRATRTRGTVVNFGSVSGEVTDLAPLELGEAGSLFLTRPRLADHMADAATIRRRATDIFDAIMTGMLSIPVAEVVTMQDLPAAHAALEERRQVGKAILSVS